MVTRHASLARAALRRLWRDESGVTGLEYGLLGFGLSIAIMATVFAIGGELNTLYDTASSQIAERLNGIMPSDGG